MGRFPFEEALMTSDDPFEAFHNAISTAKPAPERPRPPTVAEALAESERLYAPTIRAVERYGELASRRDPAFSVAWRKSRPDPTSVGFPINIAVIVARRGAGAEALEIEVKMQDTRLWIERDKAIQAASGNDHGKWTPDEQDALIAAIGRRLSAYFIGSN